MKLKISKHLLSHILIAAGFILVVGTYFLLRFQGNDSSLSSALSGDSENRNQVSPPLKAELRDLGPAPEFKNIERWLNADSQTMAGLKGKVVLVHFWTYSCMNCIKALPHLNQWHDAYKDKGLAVIGIHTPEFVFEKSADNVQTAISRYGISYPIAQDNNYATWTAFKNQFWPATYLIDHTGTIAYTHFGEGRYEETKSAINQLLEAAARARETGGNQAPVNSPQIGFGLDHLEFMANRTQANAKARLYGLPATIPVNTFALGGQWQLEPGKAILAGKNGRIRLRFNAGKVLINAQSSKPIEVRVLIDGKAANPVVIGEPKAYILFNSTDYREHTLELQIPQAGLDVTSFTFG